MANSPKITFYNDFESSKIDLEEMYNSLIYRDNCYYFDGEFLGASPTMIKIKELIEKRTVEGLSLILAREDGLLFKEYFVKRYLLNMPDGDSEFLLWHFENSFERDKDKWLGFVELLFAHFDYFNADSYKGRLILKITDSESSEPPVEGLPGKDKTKVTIPVKINERTKNDGYTSLSEPATAALFFYLRESKIILDDKTLLSDTSLSYTIQIQTGYKGDMRKLLGKKEHNNNDLEKIKSELQNIISLINRDLKKNLPPKK